MLIINFKFKLKTHKWVTKNETCLLISNLESCDLITVTDDEVKNSIKTLAKLDTLVIFLVSIQRNDKLLFHLFYITIDICQKHDKTPFVWQSLSIAKLIFFKSIIN